MLRVLQYNGESDSVSEIPIEEMDFHKLKWLDCFSPDKKETEKLKSLIDIPDNELDRCLDEDERPSITELEHFSMIEFKSPFKIGSYHSTTSIAILISDNLFVTFRRKEEIEAINNFWDLDEKSKTKVLKKGSTYLAYHILEKVMDDYFKVLDDVEKEIDVIDKEVFSNPDKNVVRKIFSMRKTLIYFHKSLASNREVISNIDKEFADKIDTAHIKKFRYIYNDIIQQVDMVATYRDILTGSLDIYLSSVSNNLNSIMKRMTAFGSLVLVPTFITGLYGMNFRVMPEIYWKYGYAFAGGLIIISVILLVWYFKKKDWF
ncbi:magnesium/cobalt transporter CorA [Bacteroidota bacterium]